MTELKVRLRVEFLPGACALVDEDVALQCRVMHDDTLVIGKEHPEMWAAEVAARGAMQNEK